MTTLGAALDWQFWVVTALAAIAAAYILRNVVPRRLRFWRRRGASQSATLTVGGRSLDPDHPRRP